MSDGHPPLNDVNDSQGLVGLGNIPGLAPVASFNIDQIKNLLRTKGIRAYHYIHALDPDSESVETGSRVDLQASNLGIRYFDVRELVVVPQSFKLEHQLQVQGLYDLETVLLNVSGNYLDGEQEQVYISPRDIIALNPTCTLTVRQKIEYNPTGPLSLKYKVKGVRVMFSSKRRFIQDQDFTIGQDGKIYWLPNGQKPEFVNGKGQVLSVVYYAQPFYIVQSVPHILRLLPSNEAGNGGLARKAEYAPQLVMATQSHLKEVNWLNFHALADYPRPSDSMNTVGG
jgi:hypothetical protein